MRTFRLKENGNIIQEYDYRCLFPNTTFSETFIPEDADVIKKIPQPTLLPAQICVSDGVEKIENEWCEKWKVVDVVPQSVAFWRAQTILEISGLMPQVLQFIDAIADVKMRISAKKKMEYSSTMQRDDPLIDAMIQRGMLTNEAVDAMFIAAERLV